MAQTIIGTIKRVSGSILPVGLFRGQYDVLSVLFCRDVSGPLFWLSVYKERDIERNDCSFYCVMASCA